MYILVPAKTTGPRRMRGAWNKNGPKMQLEAKSHTNPVKISQPQLSLMLNRTNSRRNENKCILLYANKFWHVFLQTTTVTRVDTWNCL